MERFESYEYEVVCVLESGGSFTTYCATPEEAELKRRLLLSPDEDIPVPPGFTWARPKGERILTAVIRRRPGRS